jgi:hypothetical protein
LESVSPQPFFKRVPLFKDLSTASGETFIVLAARGVKPKQILNIATILVVIAALGGMIVDLLIK